MSLGIESYDLVFLTKGCEKRCEKAVRRCEKRCEKAVRRCEKAVKRQRGDTLP